MRPANPSKSSIPLTSTGSTPSFFRISTCSRTSPCSASTPILAGPSVFSSALRAVTRRVSPLPATRRQLLPLREIPHLLADHRLAQALAPLRDGLRVVEAGRGLYEGVRPSSRFATLEDSTPHEDTVCSGLNPHCSIW